MYTVLEKMQFVKTKSLPFHALTITHYSWGERASELDADLSFPYRIHMPCTSVRNALLAFVDCQGPPATFAELRGRHLYRFVKLA